MDHLMVFRSTRALERYGMKVSEEGSALARRKMELDEKYDVIVIGSGPNGLAIGAYLAKAGVKVAVLEARTETGGGLQTEAITLPDFWHNTHSIYHMMVDYAPVYPDFKLEERNIRYIWPDLQFAMPLRDGRCLCLYKDVEKTCNSIAQFSKSDAEAYREFRAKLDRYMEEFLGPATYSPAVPILEQLPILESSEIGREIATIAEKPALEIVNDIFESEQVRTMMLYLACHWGIEYDASGVGYMTLINLSRSTNYRLLERGSHVLNAELNKLIHEDGGRVVMKCLVSKIIVKDGVATGVELDDGTVVEATRAVVSTVDPHQTFLKMVGEQNLDRDFVDMIENWQWEDWSLFTAHLALDEPPHFKAAESNPDIDKACVYILGYETQQDLIDHWEAIKKGEITDKPGFNACFPSVHDPTQSPGFKAGQCTGLISEMAPYNIPGGSEAWLSYKFREEVAEKRIAVLREYAPNLTPDKVLWVTALTPTDTANKLIDMVEGSIKQGAYSALQMGYLRPNQECSQNRTPVKNLYVGGSSCYPGGMINFGPGYLAANAVAEDLGITKWWSEPPSITKAREAGLL